MSRRTFMMALPAPLVQRLGAPDTTPRLTAVDLNHAALKVSDLKRSLEFYQGLFGLPIQARQGTSMLLRVSAGPQSLALSAAGLDAPGISHICITIEDFAVDRVVATLAAHGVRRADEGSSGLAGGKMRVRVRERGPGHGGAPEGTPEIFLGDPDGLVMQLQERRYCGGAGVRGDVCRQVELPPSKGLLAVSELNHFTMRVPDATRSNAFYQALFGFRIRSYQGPAVPTLAIGRVGFLVYSGRRGGVTASIDHVCLNMDGFDVERVIAVLERYGIKPRGTDDSPGPLQWYISTRMEDRGGAREGTPELYFTDPDGIPIQLQDRSYCGGSGVLGNVCLS